MATILASRCQDDIMLPEVRELYTYGSPRVGNAAFCCSLSVTHSRWVNNNDVVTRVPLWIMGYRHDGNEQYISSCGKQRSIRGLSRAWDRIRGIGLGLAAGRFDSISDHSMPGYVNAIERLIND
jgi:triacylglycerol lipase